MPSPPAGLWRLGQANSSPVQPVPFRFQAERRLDSQQQLASQARAVLNWPPRSTAPARASPADSNATLGQLLFGVSSARGEVTHLLPVASHNCRHSALLRWCLSFEGPDCSLRGVKRQCGISAKRLAFRAAEAHACMGQA